MYARFLISLAMLSIAMTISAIHIYSSSQKYYEPFIKDQQSVSAKTSFQFYSIPPLLVIATIKALYKYENYTWFDVVLPKDKKFVKTGINGKKFIKWMAVVAGREQLSMHGNDCVVGGEPIEIVCEDRDSAGNCICKQETFAYIRTYLNFFTNVTKKKYLESFTDFLQYYGNKELNYLNKYNEENFSDNNMNYEISNVEVFPIANITRPVLNNASAILMVIYVVSVTNNGKLLYKLRVPFEIDIQVKVIGNLKDAMSQKLPTSYVVSYAYVDRAEFVNGHCTPTQRQEVEGVPTIVQYHGTCYDMCPCVCSGKDCKQEPCPHGFTMNINQWNRKSVYTRYGVKTKIPVIFSKAGYTGVHYVYRVVNKIIYRQDLTNIPYRSFKMPRIYNMILTPFVRLSGAVYNQNWVINDTWVKHHDTENGYACFAISTTDHGWGNYGINYNYKGLPQGGYCNGMSYFVSSLGVDTGEDVQNVLNGISACKINTRHEHVCNCYVITDIYDRGTPAKAELYYRRCLRPVTDTINKELLMHRLILDAYCWNQTSMDNQPFDCD